MPVEAPPVDRRDFAELVRATRAAVRESLGLTLPPDGLDAPVPGDGLVHIFARLAEIVVERLNRVPDKNLLAFLALVGVDQQPPQPARVPLTFHLAQGASRARVPAGTTAAAAPATGETAAPVYETERELVLTATQLTAAFTREPARDLYRDATAATTPAGTALPVFEGASPIPHELYVADPLLSLPQPKNVALRLGPLDTAHRWPDALSWSRFDGAGWQPLSPTIVPDSAADAWRVVFQALPAVEPTVVAGAAGAWLRARLETPLPPPEPGPGGSPAPDTLQQGGLPADAVFADDRPLDPRGPLAPFGEAVPRTVFSIASGRAFSKPGAAVELDVVVDGTRPATPAASLELTWSYWSGAGWTVLGTSSAGDDEEGAGLAGGGGFVDGTRAFTRDGTIAFAAPADWRETTVGGVTAHWLRATVSSGDWGSPPAYAAPVLERLSIGYTWPLPRVATLTRAVAVARQGLQPDAALFGATALDLTKDFRPFGDKPHFNDVLYLAGDEALSLPNARITLHVKGTKAVSAAGSPQLAWEVYDGASGRWTAATVEQDTTGAFTFASNLNAVVVLRAPAAPAPVALAGQERYWVRVRLVGGNFGKDADFTTTTSGGQTVITPVAASWDPPSIQAVSVDYDFVAAPSPPAAAVTLNDFRAVVPSGPFLPFTVTDDERPTFYLGAASDFGNDPTTLFFELPDVIYDAGEGRQPPPAEPATVVWEYRSTDGWRPLGTRDETRGFAGRGLLTFVGPPDLSTSTEFGVTARWLRARWERGGYPAQPQLARVLTNTVWASHFTTVRDEVLGSSTGEERQVFATARTPVLPGQQIEVRELGAPSAAELGGIVAEEGEDAVLVVPATPTAPAETWVRWHEVVDFYGSGPRSRHYVLDRLSGEVRFGDGRRGMAPPQGRGNVRARLYRTGGGATGNRAAGTIVQLKAAIPYVDKVTNPEPAAGGADAEALDAVRERGPRQLRHGNRAVTMSDVEDLAREASPGIVRVLGVPASDGVDAGGVGVVVVPASDERLPAPSVELLERVRAHVEERLPVTARLWVAGPGWLEIAVTAEVVPLSPEQATDVQGVVRTALETFLHPLRGGPRGEGWPFGRIPRRSDLLALIEGLPGVDHVRGLTVAQTETAPPPAPAALLVYSADHTITMAGSTEEPPSEVRRSRSRRGARVTLPLPQLDDRTFADLVDEARTLIPTYQPEWTNYNPSDPGITLVELFAWLAEMLIYRADRIPERHRLVFLRLLNGPAWTADPELSVDDQVAATLTRLRSRYRAVTVDDYEALALEASPLVARALCLPRRDLASADEAARTIPRPGYVSIVVLPPDGMSDDDAAALRTAVGAYLEPRRLLTTQHVVAEPVWAPVSAEVLVARRSDVPEELAHDAVADALTRFLDPRRGGRHGTGWPFGRDVYVSELYAVLEGLPEIDYIPDIQLASSCGTGDIRCAEAVELWDAQGDQVGLGLAPHHLPRAELDPGALVVSASFVAIRATVTAEPLGDATPADVRRRVKTGLRILFHPRYDGPTGSAPWSIGSDRALASLRARLAGIARVASVAFDGDPLRVRSDERDVITVWLDEHELADLQTDVVLD